MEATKTEKLSFYTTGDSFTNLLNNFFKEGKFKSVYEILSQDGKGLDDLQIKLFFLGLNEFEGDTREGDLLFKSIKRKPEQTPNQRIFWALRNCCSHNDIDIQEAISSDLLNEKKAHKEFPEFHYLSKVLTRKTILDLIWKEIILSEGYEINPSHLKNYGDGVIIPTGEYITCHYMGHKDLYPLLASLEIANDSDWIDDTKCIHVSSSQMSGKVAWNLKERNFEKGRITQEQIATIVKYEAISRVYGEWETKMMSILSYTKYQENYGGKFNNLIFLDKYFPEINLPKFSKEMIEGVKNCIRTSPKYSLPGLLESKFDIDGNSIKEICETFEKYKNVINGNELHYFYQEFIEGENGVAHYLKGEEFNYSVSSTRGDIVSGKKSTRTLPIDVIKKLSKICSNLYKKLDSDIQVEFVISDDKVYIVQLRILENPYERAVQIGKPENTIYTGRTFSKGTIEDVKKEDILVVHEDAQSELLLGKKALIVESDTEFSHILALSKSLGIPSIYATGKVRLPNVVNIVAFNKEGFITSNEK